MSQEDNESSAAQANAEPTADTAIVDDALNEIESTLFAMFKEEMTREEFLGIFLASQLYILVDGEPTGNTLGDKKPMVVSTSPSAPRLMAVFSHPSRAAKMQQLFPEYNFPILVDCDWVFRTIGNSMGVTVNPGWHYGFEIAPEGAQQIKKAITEIRTTVGEDP